MLNKLTLKIIENSYVKSSTIEVEDLAILVGYNATLRSIIARTFLHCEEKDDIVEFSTLRDLDIGYVIDPSDLPCNSLRGYIPDARIMLRELYSSYERILELVKHLDSIAERVRRLGKETPIDESEIEKVKSMIQEIISRLGLKMVTDVVGFKKRADSQLLERVKKIYEEVLNNIVRKLEDDYEEDITPEEIAPLEILEVEEGGGLPILRVYNSDEIAPLEILEIDEDEGLPTLRVYDKRFRNEIRRSLLSSSVVAPLLIEYIIGFMSLPPAKETKSRILVIEEPEEALTPLQQILIMRFLHRALKEMDELIKAKTFVIVTTNSPYVAFATDAKLYFLRFDRKSNRITISKDKPHTPFVLADLLLNTRET